ncbi:MAG: CRISPR-associated helicase Cas3' [Candidatus Scalindua sediminis]|nr:CRISPR-associated helicase Cas3' [Candidatus Scalindua sediminis]
MFQNVDYVAHRREQDGTIQSLDAHLEEVSKIAGEFASKIGLKEQGEIIGLLHDIGKSSKEFDQYIKSAVGLINTDEDDYVDAAGKKGKVDHSTAGAQLIFRTLSDKGPEALFAAQVMSLCLVSHHSGLIDCISPDGMDAYSKRINKDSEKTHISEATGNLTNEALNFITSRLQSEKLYQNLVDKFKSLRNFHDDKETRETLAFKHGLLLRFLFSCLIDADRLNTADFDAPDIAKLRNCGKYDNWDSLIKKLDKKLNGFDLKGINAIRHKISQACLGYSGKPKGLYQLTVPTGGGKTFASLRFALHHAGKYKMDRIIYVLPYTTIIDQNAEEIRKVLEDKDEKGQYLDRVVLEHHSNLLPDKESARQKVLSENWDAPVVLTTNVQVLEALFGSGTRGARRMHQLANAVIIFDEVQTLSVKCVHLFNVAVDFLVNNCGSSVILCTATQPLLDKIEKKSRALSIAAEQQIISNEKQIFENLKRVEVHDKTKDDGWNNDEIIELAGQELAKSGSVLIVVNTKKSARELYQQCQGMKNGIAYHLSTNMCPAHRMKVLQKVKDDLSDKKPVICISTQLIEAGVDISFGSVIRFLAGLDSITQAAGRCNRHNEMYPALGDVYIINPADENIDSLEDIRIGKEKTERLLDEFKNNPEKYRNNLLSPEAMEQYYQYYFYQRKDDMCYPVRSKSPVGHADNLFNLLARNKVSVSEYERMNGKAPGILLRQAFMSAARSFDVIDTAARGIVVQYGKEGKTLVNNLCSAYELEKQYKLLRQAQRYSVNVFPHVLTKLLDEQAIYEVQEGSGIFYLDKRYYSKEFGLNKTPVTNMEFFYS